MKVILQQDVKGQGKKGQLIEASDGYARNFLLPRKLAVPATAENINTMKMQEKAKKAQEAAEKAEAEATAARLKELTVKVVAKGGNGGRLFGAVTSKEIADALQAQHGITIPKTKIVQDEPIKMRRLGGLYHIDVEALSDMWIVKNQDGADLSQWVESIRELSAHFASIGLCEPYEGDILIFPVGSRTLRDMNDWGDALIQFCESRDIRVKITRCSLLQKTSDARYAYEINQSYLDDAVRVFPLRPFFTLSEIEFVKECREIAAAGKESVRWYTCLLEPILAGRDGEDIVRTLEVYLLDQNSSIIETAKALFVHKNTVKYRIQKAGDILGFHIGDVPQSKNLIYALSLQRIMKTT